MSAGLSVQCDDDCGNSPRKADVCDFVVAWGAGDTVTVEQALSSEATWDVVGESLHERHGVAAYVEAVAAYEATAIRFANLLSHGKAVAAHGTLTTSMGDKRFSHVVEYTGHGKSAKIAHVTSYVITI